MSCNHQDYTIVPVVRAAAGLTTSYVAGTVFEMPLRNQLVLLIQFTKDTADSAEIKVETSYDGSTYYQESFGSVSGGTETDTLGIHQLTAAGNYRIPIRMCDRWVKISVKGTGTLGAAAMTVNAVIGTV